MRILIVLNTHVDSRSVSGIMKLFALSAKAWMESGHQVDFLVAKAVFPALRPLVPGAGLISSDSIFDLTRVVDRTWLYFFPYAWRLLTAHFVRLRKRYDVVYASSHFIVETYPAAVLARRTGARLAIKVPHVLSEQSNRRALFDRLFIAAEKWSARLIQRHATLITCLTDVVATDYKKLEARTGVPPSSLHVVGCGLDLHTIAALPPRQKVWEVVFLSRMHEKKGVFELPLVWEKVIGQLPPARLLVIGEGPHRKRTEELFRSRGVMQGVTFTGGIPENEKNRLLTESKVGLSLSYEEGWGLSITEFMAAGIPVVGYNLPVFAGVFGEHLVVTKPGDVNHVAREIIALLKNPEHLRTRGQASRDFILRYDYRTVAAEDMSLLSS